MIYAGLLNFLLLKEPQLFFFCFYHHKPFIFNGLWCKGSVIPLNWYVCGFLPLFLKAHRFSFLMCPT